jgi:CRP-like cAMP-binding protein
MSIVEITRHPVPSSLVWPFPGKPAAGAPAELDSDRQMLERSGSKLRFERGETIFNEGDPVKYGYRVVSGGVRLCKHMADGRRQIAEFLLPGDFFSFAETDEHSFTAEAMSDVTLACYPQHAIQRLSEECVGLRGLFRSLLSKRIREAENHLVILGRQNAREKVASFLVLLIDRCNTDEKRLALPMSRQDIADFLGLTMETVSRVLSAMKREKLIELPALHELVIRDQDSLRALADGEE